MATYHVNPVHHHHQFHHHHHHHHQYRHHYYYFSSFMLTHAQAMNEYRGGEMSTEVVVDRNLWTEIVDRSWK